MFGGTRQLFRFRNLKLGQQCVKSSSTKVEETTAIEKQCSSTPTVSYGQPTPMTHPHLLKPNELTPGFEVKEYQRRRSALIGRILEKQPDMDHLVVIASAGKQYMSENIPYVFRQNTDFNYFTGCMEPDSAMVLDVRKNGEYSSIMFVRPKDEHAEIWDGARTGVEGAKLLFGVDQALPVTEFPNYCAKFLQGNDKGRLWYDKQPSSNSPIHTKISQLLGDAMSCKISAAKPIMHEIRLIKSSAEVQLLQKSCDITAEAIKETIRATKPGISEHELFATVDYHCRMNGAEFLAYPPVVAAGKNATTIHYISNNQRVKDGDLVLMDAGSEYHGYAADITRTWPANGTFSPIQKVLYEIVLDIQGTLIKELQDMPSLDDVFRTMCSMLGERLSQEGVISKHQEQRQRFYDGYKFCSHHAGHYLGMDVHDTGTVSRSQPIRPGMVVTIEPGVYVSPKNELARPEFHGIGIRIEDDILITASGPVILSRNCPKSVQEIEALARENNV